MKNSNQSLRYGFHVTPAMKASCETFGFFAHDCQEEFSWFFWLLGTQVLDVDLSGFVA